MAPKYNRKKPVQHKSNSKKSSTKKKQLYIVVGILAIVLIIVGAYVAVGFNSNNDNSTATPTPTPTTTNGTKVLLQTSMGNITIQLFDDKPITTQNFLDLVASGKYDGTVFHRIMKDFMIQGGAINGDLATIKDEIGSYNHNYQYTIAMAKTNDPNSATSGFFINTVDNSKITYSDGTKFDDTYTAFGIVVEGKDVVNAIAKVPVTANISGEVSQPTQTVTLISATIIS
ncbi:MAG: peptidylprolyl isomerase [Candidatus Bathyarchaeota archaeon]|nr:peptidylprolyl isomerase [Candidatus Termiticorpusculum sp.]